MPEETESTAPKVSATRSMRRIFGLARHELRLLGVATVALLAGSGLALLVPQGVRDLIDALSQSDGRAQLDAALVILLGVFVGVAAFGFLRGWLFTWAGERVVARLRRDLFSHLVGQEIGFFDAQRTGELLNRLAADTGVLQNSVTVNISMALRFGIQAVGSLAILFYSSTKLTLVMLSVVPVAAIGAVLFARRVRELATATQDALASANTVAEEVFGNLRTVRSFAQEQSEIARYSANVDEALDAGRRTGLAYGVFQGAGSLAAFAGLGMVLWVGGGMVIDGTLSTGDLTAYMMYTFYLAFSLGALSALFGDFNRAIGASQRVFELLDRRPQVGTAGGLAPASSEGEMVLDSVSFAYPTRPDVTVLHEVTLVLRPGRVVALVGHSGSGKSTVASLLARFYDPAGGMVRYDGADVRALDPDWLRRQVGMVSQEPVLFAASIADNIRYGRPSATDAEVEAAARVANAHVFIHELPERYATLVGERGVRLSGGQRQRIAIARAVLKDPKVLVLDEATSALDAESEHLVQEALERLMAGRASLVIAHRLSTVKNADEVVVFDHGRRVESGSHTELVARGGVYARLVEHQFQASA